MSALNIQKGSPFMPEVKQKWNSTLHCVRPPSSTGMFSLLFGRRWIMSDSVHDKCVQVNWNTVWGDSFKNEGEKCLNDKQGAKRSESREYVHWVGNWWKNTTTTDDQFETNYHFLPNSYQLHDERHQWRNETLTHQRILKAQTSFFFFFVLFCLLKENNFLKWFVPTKRIDGRRLQRSHADTPELIRKQRLPMDEIHSIFFLLLSNLERTFYFI